MSSYHEVEHTADWAIHIRASNMEGLLHSAAKGMLEMMGMESSNSPRETTHIEITSSDRESLLVEWLEELLYIIESKAVGFDQMEIDVENDRKVIALVKEIPNVTPSKEIKAVTYHGLKIEDVEDGLEATVVFDV